MARLPHYHSLCGYVGDLTADLAFWMSFVCGTPLKSEPAFGRRPLRRLHPLRDLICHERHDLVRLPTMTPSVQSSAVAFLAAMFTYSKILRFDNHCQQQRGSQDHRSGLLCREPIGCFWMTHCEAPKFATTSQFMNYSTKRIMPAPAR